MLPENYGGSLSLLTDLYQLTMAYGYFKTEQHKKQAIFNLFYRKAPFGGSYAIACGLQQVIKWLSHLQFSDDDIEYLRSLTGAKNQALFDEDFLNYLQDFRFRGSIYAVPEGTVVFPHQPLLRVEGNLIECQLVETALLNIVNFQTLIATKAARVCAAAENQPVIEFGLRRAQGIDGGISASRAAYIGGCTATSNVLAGKLWGIPVRGTHAHSWVMSFDSELEAFAKYAEVMPQNCTLLVDTYDTLDGVKHAIEIGKSLETRGYQLQAIRLDSGDLNELSQVARRMLDEAGMTYTNIIASNDLDEYAIQQLKADGAKINVWGVGTKLVTAYDQPALGGVYKLSAIRADNDAPWQYRIKQSNDWIKISNPGKLQVRRYYYPNGLPATDVLYNEWQGQPTHVVNFADQKESSLYQGSLFKDLLVPISKNGIIQYNFPQLADIRSYAQQQVAMFAQQSDSYINGIATQLLQLKNEILEKI